MPLISHHNWPIFAAPMCLASAFVDRVICLISRVFVARRRNTITNIGIRKEWRDLPQICWDRFCVSSLVQLCFSVQSCPITSMQVLSSLKKNWRSYRESAPPISLYRCSKKLHTNAISDCQGLVALLLTDSRKLNAGAMWSPKQNAIVSSDSHYLCCDCPLRPLD